MQSSQPIYSTPAKPSTLLEHVDILHEATPGCWETLRDGFLGYHGDRIDFISAEAPRQAYDRRLPLRNHLVMPGLYNLHTHTGMTSLRGVGSGLPLLRWLHEAMFPNEAKFNDNDLIVNSQIAMMEMLASGVVSFSDMYRSPWLIAPLVAENGLKANLSSPFMTKIFDDPEPDRVRCRLADDFFKQYHNSANGRIHADFAIHAEYTSRKETAREYSEVCRSNGARMHLHLSETPTEHNQCIERHGVTPARFFYEIGTFDNPTNAAHCVVLTDDDIAILKEKNVTAIHVPTSNMKLGSGFMPIRKLLDTGVPVVLGTDSTASNNNQNFLEEMHLASVIHNGYQRNAAAVHAEEILTMATSAGATAQGRADSGRITIGAKADLTVLDLDRPHLMPNHDTAALVVYAAQASDVVATIVDGRTLYAHGEYRTIDAERVKHEYRKACSRIYNL